MTEPDALIQRAYRYLKSAELLLKDGDNESSISRSYYAMLYCAQAALLTKQLSFSSHKGVISMFGEHFIKTGIFPREMGRELNLAFTKRQLGDYTHTFIITPVEAEQMLVRAKKFVSRVEQHLNQNK